MQEGCAPRVRHRFLIWEKKVFDRLNHPVGRSLSIVMLLLLSGVTSTSSPGHFSLALGAGRPAPKAREKRPGDEVGVTWRRLIVTARVYWDWLDPGPREYACNCDQFEYVIGLHAVQFGNNWMKTIPRIAKIGRGRGRKFLNSIISKLDEHGVLLLIRS